MKKKQCKSVIFLAKDGKIVRVEILSFTVRGILLMEEILTAGQQ
jgi:hypothetical protein